jgi:hypothetical protein
MVVPALEATVMIALYSDIRKVFRVVVAFPNGSLVLGSI